MGALKWQEVDIALSTIRERLMDVHATQALELIEHAREHVATLRALDIYCHLHRVRGHEYVALRTRVLSRLGQQGPGRQPPGDADTSAAEEWDSPWSWILRMRRRLQGRKNLELRRWVELHCGRTEAKLLSVHVGGTLRLIELLKPESSYAEVAQLYTESMAVPQSLSRAIYFLALSELSEPALVIPVPAMGGSDESSEGQDGQPLRVLKG